MQEFFPQLSKNHYIYFNQSLIRWKISSIHLIFRETTNSYKDIKINTSNTRNYYLKNYDKFWYIFTFYIGNNKLIA